MSLKERIQEDMKESLRSHDAERTGVLRLLRAAIHNAEIDQQHELDDGAVLAVLAKAVKERRESIELYRQGRREELAAAEERELTVIESYLPRQLSEGELRTVVNQAIAELGAQGPTDMSRVMKHLMAQLRGQADGRLVNTLVREALTGQGGR